MENLATPQVVEDIFGLLVVTEGETIRVFFDKDDKAAERRARELYEERLRRSKVDTYLQRYRSAQPFKMRVR